MVMNLFHIFLHCNVINVWGKNHDNKTVLILLFPKAEHNNTMLKKKKERDREMVVYKDTTEDSLSAAWGQQSQIHSIQILTSKFPVTTRWRKKPREICPMWRPDLHHWQSKYQTFTSFLFLFPREKSTRKRERGVRQYVPFVSNRDVRGCSLV